MGKFKNKLLIFLASIFGAGLVFGGGVAADHFLHIGDKAHDLLESWNWIKSDEDVDASTEKTGALSMAACNIIKTKSSEFYTATETRYGDLIGRNDKIEYTPLFIKTTDDGISFTYKSSVKVGEDKTLEDLLTAKLNINKNAETEELFTDLVRALKKDDEKAASELIDKLSQNANIEVSYSTEATNNNANLSNVLAEKISVENLPGALDNETKTAIMDKLAAKDFVVTQFAIKANDTTKGQISEDLEDITDNNGVTTTYCNLTAKLVNAEATVRVCVNDAIYFISVNQGNLSFNLGKQPWDANGVSAANLAKLINEKYANIKGEELDEALKDMTIGAEPTISVSSPNLGNAIKTGHKVSVGLQYGTIISETIEEEDNDLIIEVPPTDEDKKDEEEKVTNDVNAALAKYNAQHPQPSTTNQTQPNNTNNTVSAPRRR